MKPMHDIPEKRSRLPRSRVVRGVLVVLLAGGVALGIWGMGRYDALVETGKRIEARFTELDGRIAYDAAANAEAPTDPARVELMLAARARMLAALPTESLPSITGAGRPVGRIEMGRELLRDGRRLEPAALALADALAEAEMSPREYRDLLMRLVNAALHGAGDVPVGEAYREMVYRIAPNTDLDYHGLGERGLGPRELELARRLESVNPMAPFADLVVLTVGDQKTK